MLLLRDLRGHNGALPVSILNDVAPYDEVENMLTKVVFFSSFLSFFLSGNKERASAASNAAVNDNSSAGRQVAPTSTKTVYGFLDFTTIVSDTMMIFKPSKTNGKDQLSLERERDGKI